ncbi:hypothetical protein C8R43DRAFT_892362 [Mycena crocata]|nr:hypothetical protein C8R43DRAFT_892362 [Mycena crocata]
MCFRFGFGFTSLNLQHVVRVSSLDPALAANASFAGLRGTGGAMVSEEYTISSNPPNPRTSFRVGDWMCRSPQCAVHNYARNLTCIGCGCPRSGTANGSVAATNDPPQSPHHQHFNPSSSSRPQPSPRFASAPNGMYYSGSPSPTTYGFPPQSPPAYGRASQHGYASSSGQSVVNLPLPSPLASPTANKNMSAHPLLTPSGRAFASGGKVQNISSDPLSPCIMYWPDNEPFPEQGQIRPSSLMGVPQPPILNTGNRGPISHQIGDWICLRCAYLNWRRRKVAKPVFPVNAEGNGDSISAAVQAERIALLTSVLAQTRLSSPGASPAPSHPQPHPIGRSHSTTPAQVQPPFRQLLTAAAVHRSQSHSELSSQFTQGYPIYQTAPHHTQQYQRPLHHPSPLQRHTVSANASPVDVYAPAPLLPSFLQDLVHSPTLSPSSTSSADLSEYEASPPSSTRSTFSLSGDDSVNVSPLQNIWRLDGEESKVLSAFPLPTRRELMGGGTSSRNNSPPRISSS